MKLPRAEIKLFQDPYSRRLRTAAEMREGFHFIDVTNDHKRYIRHSILRDDSVLSDSTIKK